MKNNVIYIKLFIILLLCTSSQPADEPGKDEIPPYQKLYEEGFYRSDICILDSLISADSVGSRKLLPYLAFCHIARGDSVRGIYIFRRILDYDPQFRLDTLLTPPKIYKVFNSALQRHETAMRISDKTPQAALFPDMKHDSPDVGTAGDYHPVSGVHSDMPEQPGRVSLIMYLPGLIPAGGGQFFNRQWIKGGALLFAQTTALVVCMWSYRKRQSFYDNRYGWYEGNMDAYNRYTNYTRIGSIFLAGTYTFSVTDYFLIVKKKNRSVRKH